ncbi:MAG: BrnT family toxin [Beijerinckiaceae bacterium]|nr:BrnT family toxin [Beijerinckiaceae bacterium]
MLNDLDFEWDEAKARSNLAKHGIGFDKAVAIFAAAFIELDATRGMDGETRRKATGGLGGSLFTVVFTRREDKIRVISARRSNPQEAKQYADRQISS